MTNYFLDGNDERRQDGGPVAEGLPAELGDGAGEATAAYALKTTEELRQAHCWNYIGAWGDRSCPKLAEVVHCHNCPVYALGASQLLERDISAEYLAEWTERIAARKELAERATSSAVVFRAGGEWLALRAQAMVVVAEETPIHSIPHRRAAGILGLASVMGELMPCVSLEKLLGLEPEVAEEAKQARPRFLMAQHDGARLAFQAREVAAAWRFSKADLQMPPATLGKSKAANTAAVLSWEGRAVALLDEERLFATVQKGLA